MRPDYADWLRAKGYGASTSSRHSNAARVEAHYGDLDGHYDRDRLRGLMETLAYSTEDGRRERPNPTTIPIAGDLRNNLASYKAAVALYGRFRESGDGAEHRRNVAIPAPARSRPVPQELPEPRSGPRTLTDFGLDGRAAIEALIAASPYRTVAQAVASLTLFSHPRTVRQTGGRALFPSIRNPRRVGQIDVWNGRRVLLDDNKTPTDAFLWANGLRRRGPDTQFNHVYAVSQDPDAYTALPNICMTPAFIAKLTDTDRAVRGLLMYRSHQLYGWVPPGQEPPKRPEIYEVLEWAAPLPPVDDVRSTLADAMATKPKNRTVLAARELGWLFGDPEGPDGAPA